MKKYAALIFIIAFAAICAAGCSDGEADSPSGNAAVGEWSLYSVVLDISESDSSEYIGESADAVLEGAADCVLTVTPDGAFDFSIGGTDTVGTYAVDGDKITFYEDVSEFPVTVENGRLTMDLTEYSGRNMKYIFVKNAES